MPTSGPRSRTPFAPATLTALAAAAALAACGSDNKSIVDPGTGTSTSPVASAYVNRALAWEHYVFYWIDRVDTTAQNTAVRDRLKGLQWTNGPADSLVWNVVDYSLDPWLRNAPPTGPDYHSLFFPPDDSPGITDASPDPRNLASGVSLAATGQPTLAYLWLPGFAGRNINGRVDSIQTVIRTLDQNNPCGWVLDLRRNLGGYTDAMIAGINPIFGDAPASRTLPGYGGDVDRDNGRELWFVKNGAAGVYDPSTDSTYTFARASNPYTLKRPGSPVAVLIGPTTASASEAITLGFRGNAAVPSRSFGEPTYGVTTGPFGIYLQPDSGYLNVTATIMFDRTGQVYGGKLQPDQVVATGSNEFKYYQLQPTPDPADPVIAAASTWLRQQSACTGAPAATAGLNASREPAGAPVLPGVVRPLSPERFRPQVHAVPRQLVERRLAGR